MYMVMSVIHYFFPINFSINIKKYNFSLFTLEIVSIELDPYDFPLFVVILGVTVIPTQTLAYLILHLGLQSPEVRTHFFLNDQN